MERALNVKFDFADEDRVRGCCLSDEIEELLDRDFVRDARLAVVELQNGISGRDELGLFSVLG
jgi:hypothetical protein